MKPRFFNIAKALAGAFTAAVLVIAAPQANANSAIVFEPCELALPNTAVRRQLECVTLQLPLYAGAKETLDISVVKLKARSRKPKPDPMLMLAGGPGQAASQAFLFADRQYSKLHRDRDIYLVDQRGTGRSTLFECATLDESVLGATPSDEDIEALTQRCLADFPYDARYFSTSAALLDYEAVRKALAIPQWNLLGVSYGTRVAQHYMRQYPEAVRSVVLDSVVAPTHALGPEIAWQSQRALDAVVMRCQRDEACAKAFPALHDASTNLVKQLAKTPVPVTYEDIRSGTSVTETIGKEALAIVLRMSLYQDETAALLPLMISQAYSHNNYVPLARAASRIKAQLDGVMAIGMHNSVICTEDVPFYTNDPELREQAAASYLGQEMTDILVQMCEVWPQGVLDDEFKAPLNSAIPTLLFSGTEDPITPPAYAEDAMQGLSNARHIKMPGQGHSVSAIGCGPTLIAQFLHELSPKALKSACVARVSAAPFFVDFNGPTP